MKDSELRTMAKDRVEFREHLLVYIVVNIVLIAINMWFTPGFWWFLLVLLFWGIGLVFHCREAYCGTREAKIEKEYRKLKTSKK